MNFPPASSSSSSAQAQGARNTYGIAEEKEKFLAAHETLTASRPVLGLTAAEKREEEQQARRTAKLNERQLHHRPIWDAADKQTEYLIARLDIECSNALELREHQIPPLAARTAYAG